MEALILMEAIKLEFPIAIVELQREMDEEIRHWLLGQALKRIRTYAAKYESDADPLTITR